VGQESGGPSSKNGYNPQSQSLITLGPSEPDELHPPMQGSQEGQNDGSIRDLYSLEVVQSRQGGLKVNSSQGVLAY
jgi:hypothetical protein